MAPVTFLLNGFHQLHQQWRCNLWRAELLLKVRERRPWGEREEVRPHSADSSQQSWGQSTDNNIAPNSSIRRQTEPGPQTLLPGHSHTNAMQRLQGALVPKPARNLQSSASQKAQWGLHTQRDPYCFLMTLQSRVHLPERPARVGRHCRGYLGSEIQAQFSPCPGRTQHRLVEERGWGARSGEL